MKYVFRSQDGFCPQCIAFGRTWIIRDRHIYGNTYEYCLTSIPLDPPPKFHFRNKAEVAAWLNEMDDNQLFQEDEYWIDFYIRRWTVYSSGDNALIEKKGIEYRYNRKTNVVVQIPSERQETGWFPGYRECVSVATEILKRKEKEK